MPEQSDGYRTGGLESDQANNNETGSRRRGHRNNKRGMKTVAKPERCSKELGQYFFYEGSNKNHPTFMEVAKQVILHFVTTVKDAGEYRLAYDNGFVLPKIELPEPPSQPSTKLQDRIWEKDFDLAHARLAKRHSNEQRLFSLIMLQMTPTLEGIVSARPEYAGLSSNSNTMGLLQLIRKVVATQSSNRQPAYARIMAEKQLWGVKQGRNETIGNYMQRITNAFDTIEQFGGHIGATKTSVEEALAAKCIQPDEATELEKELAHKRASEKYKAIVFILNLSDRYNSLRTWLHNNSLDGSDPYPNTLAEASTLAQQFDLTGSGAVTPDQHSLNFFNTDTEDDQSRNNRRQRNGRNNRGGRGQSNHTQSNRGSSNGRNQDERVHVNEEIEDNNNGGGSVNNYNSPATPYTDIRRVEMAFEQFDHSSPQLLHWILADTCSTIDIFFQKSLLHDVRAVDHYVHVRCNAGVVKTNLQGYFLDYPRPVWLLESGVANILSFEHMSHHYHIQYDNRVFLDSGDSADNKFQVHTSKGTIHFRPCDKGLYRASIDSIQQEQWALIETVEEKKSNYTKRDRQRAALSRRIQNIIQRPGVREFTNIVKTKDWPINVRDIQIAEDIYGTNLGSLKGKTVARPGHKVIPAVTKIPAYIIKHYADVTLSMDILFVNSIPFLITISRGIKFGTVEVLPNRQLPTIVRSVRRVINLYRHRKLHIHTILGDPEFQPLDNELTGIDVDCCGADEHSPEIERYVRTVKDRVRSQYNMLPFSHIPRMMLIRMVMNSVFWLNSFPSKNGVSDTLSPAFIVTGREINFRRHVREEFGAYVQTHEKHTNDMNARTLGAICLGPTGSIQGSHYFLSLATGKRL